MKKMMLLSLCSMVVQIFSVTVDGYAFLEGESDHRGIEVFFQRVVPDTMFTSTVYTDSVGYYSQVVENGIYTITYSKYNFNDSILYDVNCYSYNTLNDITLEAIPTGLSGVINGTLVEGSYEVVGNLTVNSGDSLVLESGVILTFYPDTGIMVNGTLIAAGSTEKRIIFTSELGNTWSGITISRMDMHSVLTYCTIERAVYGLQLDHNTITLENIRFYNNNRAVSLEHEYLDGLESDRSDLILSNSEFYNNTYGVNMDILNVSVTMKVIINNCLFNGNTAIRSFLNTCSPGKVELRVYNSTITGCTYVLYQDGLFQGVTDNSVSFYNTVISDNTVGSSFHVINKENPEEFIVNINNCCLFNNYPGILDNTEFPYIGVNVTTNSNGDPCDPWNNISIDPLFVDAENGDFRLQSGSPCIDAGTNTIDGYEFPIADLDKNYRIWDGDGNGSEVVDMGAYEYGSISVGIETGQAGISDFALFQNYPNPFNPVTTISYALPNATYVELDIYNLTGQLVQSLVSGKQDKGIHDIEFNASDLTSGMYFYNLKVDGSAVKSKKMMLLK